MKEKDVIERIVALCEARSWTTYRLSKKSGIPYSTLCTMLHKSNAPSISTLIKICNGFGITLAQFFDTEQEPPALTGEDLQLLECWHALSRENRANAGKYMAYLRSQQ